MGHTTESITTFLRSFDRTSNTEEVTALAQRFAEKFVAAGPDGATVANRQDFELALPRRKKMFDDLGCRSTKLDSAVVTKLDDRYSMAEAIWRMTFAHGEGQISDVLVRSTYILDTKDELKILFYLSHQEITAVLRKQGILKT
jgi:hypothetical protein